MRVPLILYIFIVHKHFNINNNHSVRVSATVYNNINILYFSAKAATLPTPGRLTRTYNINNHIGVKFKTLPELLLIIIFITTVQAVNLRCRLIIMQRAFRKSVYYSLLPL